MSNTISLYRGNDKTLQLTVKTVDDAAYGLTDCVVKMYIKKRIEDSDSEAIITKTGTITDATNGVVEFYLIPDDTNDVTELEDGIPYPVDFEVTAADGKKYTALRTTFVILPK